MTSGSAAIINDELCKLNVKNIRAVITDKKYPCDSCILDLKVCNGAMAAKCAASLGRLYKRNLCFVGSLQGYDEYELAAKISSVFSLVGNIVRAHE